jgi:hypothetical protein
MSRNHWVGSWYPVMLVEMGPRSAAGDTCARETYRRPLSDSSWAPRRPRMACSSSRTTSAMILRRAISRFDMTGEWAERSMFTSGTHPRVCVSQGCRGGLFLQGHSLLGWLSWGGRLNALTRPEMILSATRTGVTSCPARKWQWKSASSLEITAWFGCSARAVDRKKKRPFAFAEKMSDNRSWTKPLARQLGGRATWRAPERG